VNTTANPLRGRADTYMFEVLRGRSSRSGESCARCVARRLGRGKESEIVNMTQASILFRSIPLMETRTTRIPDPGTSGDWESLMSEYAVLCSKLLQ
jgi:hypothetical protein